MSADLGEVLTELRALRAEVAELRALRGTPPPGALTVREAAARLGCHRNTIHELINEGRLTPAPRVGRHSRVTLASVLALEAPASESFPAFPKPAPTRPATFDGAAELLRLEELERERKRSGNVKTTARAGSNGHELVGKTARRTRKLENA